MDASCCLGLVDCLACYVVLLNVLLLPEYPPRFGVVVAEPT